MNNVNCELLNMKHCEHAKTYKINHYENILIKTATFWYNKFTLSSILAYIYKIYCGCLQITFRFNFDFFQAI